MRSLVNETVSHNKFGAGKIVEENALKIRVQFSETEQPKIFAFPIAFEKFLVLEDSVLQEECRELARQKRIELEQEEAKRLDGIKRMVDEKRRERLEAIKKKRQTGKKKTGTTKTAVSRKKASVKEQSI